MQDANYAGDKLPKAVWDMLASDARAVLVDVRTLAEWIWVGRPDLTDLGKEPLFISWQTEAGRPPNPDFGSLVAARIPDKETPILFLCRSGGRSHDAAIAVTALGYTQCYNVATGFEGDRDAADHRGTVAGWRVDGLPWVQD